MSTSSALCHQQEEIELDRAQCAQLKNVRDIAARAAEAWRREGVSAVAAEQRELGRLNRAKFAKAVQRSQTTTRASLEPEDQHD